jgi:hypothetical protein
MRTAPGFTRFEAFCAEAGIDDDDSEPVSFDTGLVSYDDFDPREEDESLDPDLDDDEDFLQQRESPITTDFDLNGPAAANAPDVVVDEEDVLPQDASAELLRWHHRLGHISPKKIRALAGLGILPKRLLECKIPLCTSCLFGKATRRP